VSEDDLLRWVRARIDPCLLGDDAAVISLGGGLGGPGGPFAVTMDSQIAGVHFVPDLDPAVLARRLLAVNLSDLAAMGAEPAHAFLALSTAPGFDHRRFFRSLIDACKRSGTLLAGGDLAQSPHATVATLTLIGRCPESGRFLHRKDAAPGHGLWLGGTIGESAAGQRLVARGAQLRGRRVVLPEDWLPEDFSTSASVRAAARRAVRRHLSPRPQLALGRWLGQQEEGAAIDISDGLAIDLRRLCAESGTGAEILASELPLPDRFADLCRTIGEDPLSLALGGGEDYVLLFTLPEGLGPPEPEARKIGRITRSKRIVLRQDGGTRVLPALGWDHLDFIGNQQKGPGSKRRGPGR
jgi:thiamine-monophosphate kinase